MGVINKQRRLSVFQRLRQRLKPSIMSSSIMASHNKSQLLPPSPVSVLDDVDFPTSPSPRPSEHNIAFTPEEIITSPLRSRNDSYDNYLDNIAPTPQEHTIAIDDDDSTGKVSTPESISFYSAGATSVSEQREYDNSADNIQEEPQFDEDVPSSSSRHTPSDHSSKNVTGNAGTTLKIPTQELNVYDQIEHTEKHDTRRNDIGDPFLETDRNSSTEPLGSSSREEITCGNHISNKDSTQRSEMEISPIDSTAVQEEILEHKTLDFQTGQKVLVVGGTHKDWIDCVGTVVKVTPTMVRVSVTGKREKLITKRFVVIIDENEIVPVVDKEVSPSKETVIEEKSAYDLCTGANVSITTGKYKGKRGEVTKITEKMVSVLIDGVGLRRIYQTSIGRYNSTGDTDSIERSALSPKAGTTTPETKNGEEWRLPDSSKGGTQFGRRTIVKVRLERSNNSKPPDTILSFMFEKRLKIVDIPLNKDEADEPYDSFVEENGSRYELISAKVQNDGDVNSGQYFSPKRVRLQYVQVSGPDLETLDLKEELLRLADFAALSPCKAMARLELLQSPAYKFSKKDPGIRFLKATDFCLIPEAGNEGSGFISEEFLVNLLGGGVAAKRCLQIQVRLVIPSMGLFKGTLVCKRVTNGPPIELPPSMQKVGPSLTNDSDERAFLLITQGGAHPNSTNQNVGRLLDPELKDPPKSFKPKKLSDMIPRLWRALGVPKETCDEYVKKSMHRRNLNHAYVVGGADPTGKLPPGHVFMTGTGTGAWDRELDSIFVTRSPCIKPKDGCMVPIVKEKPETMLVEDWEWLCRRPFGSIIFASPNKGMTPLPNLIASGDLDGDLYFCCWNKEVLNAIKTEPLREVPTHEEETSASLNEKGNIIRDEMWLEKAQKMMIDSTAMQQLSALFGKLYSSSIKEADASPDLFMHHPDAIAFANAYTQALDHGKHGGEIFLPIHLHDRLPFELSKYLTGESTVPN
eukprot:scaffold21264_cov42-Attheya_sp.AAC.3